jgi:putative membrane protein
MSTRPPAAFDLSEVRYEPEDLYPPEEAGELVPAQADMPAKRPRRWLRLFLAAASALVAMALGLAVDTLIRDLFARHDWLGWTGLVLAGLAGFALLAVVGGEIVSIVRLRRIDRIRDRATAASEKDDREAALAVTADLIALYRARPDTARGRARLQSQRREIIDGHDLMGLAETELLGDLDAKARRIVVASAKRVALVTAVSPRAVVDLAFVAVEILRLIRRMAVLYAGRPGTLGFLRLARATLTHLAVTGGMAAGDSIVQQVLGHGLAARISARLGEGVVNGLLTARIGIAAAEVCRPLAYREGKPPRLADVTAVLRPLGGTERGNGKQAKKSKSDTASPDP